MKKLKSREDYFDEITILINILISKKTNITKDKEREKINKILSSLYSELKFLDNKKNKFDKEKKKAFDIFINKIISINEPYMEDLEKKLTKQANNIFKTVIPGTSLYVLATLNRRSFQNEFIFTKTLDNYSAIRLHSLLNNYESAVFNNDREKEFNNGLEEWRKIGRQYKELIWELDKEKHETGIIRPLTSLELQITKDRILHFTKRYTNLYIVCNDVISNYAEEELKKIVVIGEETPIEDIDDIYKRTLEYAQSILNLTDIKIAIKFKKPLE